MNIKTKLLAAGALAVSAWTFLAPSLAAEQAVKLPAPAQDLPATAPTATAVFAGGCFWGVQAVFQHVKGVKMAYSGYAGGPGAMAHYEIVSTGTTGHAEAVQVVFDPHQISAAEV